MNRAELHQKIMEEICVPNHFSDYNDAAVLLTILEEASDDQPFQHLADDDNPEWSVWEPFEYYIASDLYSQMDSLANNIIDFLVENNLAADAALRR